MKKYLTDARVSAIIKPERNKGDKKMYAINYTNIIACKTSGDTAQQTANFYHTGKTERHDSRPWYEGSDIEEIAGSVKSNGFSLADGRTNHGETLDEKWNDFRTRTASRVFIYVTAEMSATTWTLTNLKAL